MRIFKPLRTPALPGQQDHLEKDELGYNFNQRMMLFDPYQMAQIRPDPRDSTRRRCLAALERFWGIEPERLAFGIDDKVFPWKKIQREAQLNPHFPAAVALREWGTKAPRDRLGIGHVDTLLHAWGYLHSYTIRCDWDRQPIILDVDAPSGPPARIRSVIFKQTPYYQIEQPEHHVVGYVDAIVPRKVQQTARVRDVDAALLGTITLTRPVSEDEQLEGFEAEIRVGEEEHPTCLFKEEGFSPNRFHGKFILSADRRSSAVADEDDAAPTGAQGAAPEEIKVGLLDDKLQKGQVHVRCELDLPIDERLVLGIMTNFAELARLRKEGWPDRPEDVEDEFFGDIAAELGPRRRRG